MTSDFCYPVVIYHDKNSVVGPLWIANFPGLNGCWAEGTTRESVIEQAPAVLQAYIEGCGSAGCPLPVAPDTQELMSADAGEVLIIAASGL